MQVHGRGVSCVPDAVERDMMKSAQTAWTFGACFAVSLTGIANGDPVVDGNLDAIYGAPSVLQNTQTNFGDNTDGDIGNANGSELNVGDAMIRDGVLYIMLAGNLEANFNKLDIFIDAREGGQNTLRNDNPDVNYDGLNRMGPDPDDPTSVGLTFEEGFEPDLFVTIGGGLIKGKEGEEYVFYADAAELRSEGGGNGTYLGSGGAGPDGVLEGSNGITIAVDNSNIGGVSWGTGISCGEGVTTGVELGVPLFLFDWDGKHSITSARVCAFVNSADHDYVSNQVLGGIGGGDNFGEPRSINFNTATGNQFFATGGVADPCPEVAGACCTDFTCSVGSEEACLDLGGTYLGDSSTCDDEPCAEECPSDITGDGAVDVTDLLQLIADWNCGL